MQNHGYRLIYSVCTSAFGKSGWKFKKATAEASDFLKIKSFPICALFPV